MHKFCLEDIVFYLNISGQLKSAVAVHPLEGEEEMNGNKLRLIN